MLHALTFSRSQKRGIAVLLCFLLVIAGIRFAWHSRPLGLPSQVVLPDLKPPPPSIRPVQVNLADSSQWRALPGIGPVLSKRIMNYRKAKGGFRSVDDLEKVYGLKPEVLDKLRPFLLLDSPFVGKVAQVSHLAPPPEKQVSAIRKPSPKPVRQEPPILDLNKADSADLVQLPGIGQKLAPRIVRFREYLGFFVDVELLRFAYGLSEENFLRMRPYLRVDSLEQYPKTDLNQAEWKNLIRFPFLSKEEVKTILNHRKTLKKFSKWEELELEGQNREWLEGYFFIGE